MSDTVIRAENISKKYRLGVINRRQLVDQIESWTARKMGRPDPHASVFEHGTDRMPTPYDFWALKDVSFEIKRGDVVGVMGRNGSGKSTLLKILSRITAPTHGSAFLKGRLASLLEVGTGFNYELTGRENVYLNGSILGLKDREIRARYDSIVEFAEIADFMDTPVKRYSSGMRVRLAFAVAAHLEPEILILDEVLAVGDAKFQEKCLNRIEDIKNSGVTVLFVSHSAQQVMKLCSKGIVLQEGRVIAQGTAKQASIEYLNTLGINASETPGHVNRDATEGKYLTAVVELMLKYLSNGKCVFNVSVDTDDDITFINVGWVSNVRLQTLNTESIWNAAPDISFIMISAEISEELANKGIQRLLMKGGQEVWILYPAGWYVRHKQQNAAFLLPQDLPEYLI